MDDPDWPEIVALVVSLLLTALLSRLGSMATAVSRSTLERLVQEEAPRALLLLAMSRTRNIVGQMVSFGQVLAIAIGIIALMSLMDPLPMSWTGIGHLLLAALFSLLSLLISNTVPPYRREEGSERPLPCLLWILYPAYLLLFLPALLLQRVQNLFVSETDSKALKEEELRHIVESETEEGTIEEEEREMIEGIFEFGDTTAKEIMVPRIDMVCAEISTPPEELLEMIRNSRHSRIPIYEERVDHIKGVVYVKDLLHALSARESWSVSGIMRDPYFAPENKNIDELLRELKMARVHMAIVVDEYGGTSGLVTLEDIIEEIVGEIQDEYDNEEQLFDWREKGQVLIADARLAIDDLNLLLQVDLPQNGYETLGGFIYSHLGRVPSPHETFDFGNLRMAIEDVVGQRITRVRIVKQEKDEETDGAEEEKP